MIELEDRLEQAGADIRDAVTVREYAGSGVMRRRQHRRTAVFSAAVVVGVVALGVAVLQMLPTPGTTESGSAAEQPSELSPYGADLPAPWVLGSIAHDEGAYGVPYWETYYYLPTEDGVHAAVVVRVTNREVAEGGEAQAGIPSPGDGGAFTNETIDGRDYSVSVDQGSYTYIWREGPDAILELVVIQMAPSAVTEQLATTVLSSVTILTDEQIAALESQTAEIPSGPETTLPAD